jgi:anthranilate synthase component 1
MEVERFSHVSHLVSEVVGEVRPGVTPFDVLRACFPAGTVSGAPKIRAMQLISELEGFRRGPYGGAVLYSLPNGTMDACIALRTMVVRNGTAYLQAGAGIVADSDPAAEHEECLRKLAALEAAIDLAEQEAAP